MGVSTMLQEIPEIYEVVVVTYDKFPYETGERGTCRFGALVPAF